MSGVEGTEAADARQEAQSTTAPAYLPKQLERLPPPTEGGQSLMGLTQRVSAHTYTLTWGRKHS